MAEMPKIFVRKHQRRWLRREPDMPHMSPVSGMNDDENLPHTEAEIEAFDEETVNELRSRARNALLTDAIAREESVENVEEALLSLEGMDTEIASKLAAHGITTRDALADLAGDELVELTGMESTKAQELIMKARAHWFEAATETPAAGASA